MTEATVTNLPVPHRDAALDLVAGQTWWTRAQEAGLEAIGMGEAPDEVKQMFLHVCQRMGLDPFRREIYCMGRRAKNGPKKWTVQVGIDGFRGQAQRTGRYLGREGPLWCGPDGEWVDVWLKEEPPTAARVIVRVDLGEGRIAQVPGTALYREYVPMEDVWEGSGDTRRRTDQQQPAAMWLKMPANQLAKCAEALAIRAAFPRDLSGIYSPEEMEQADAAERNAEQVAARVARATAAEVLRENRRIGLNGEGLTAPLSPGETIPADRIIDAEPATPDTPENRARLLDELAAQAKALDTSVPAMTNRWKRANKKNIEDATVDELDALLAPRREQVAQILAETSAAAEPSDGAVDPAEPPDSDPVTPDAQASRSEDTEKAAAAEPTALEALAAEVARARAEAQQTDPFGGTVPPEPS